VSLLIGVDVGTSETKAGLFDLQGNLLRLARSGYPVITWGEAGRAEQDPERWWSAVRQTLREVTQGVMPGEIEALCIEGQGPSVVMVDESGQPLYNGLLWMDTRTVAQRDELSKRLGRPVSPFAYTPLAMWLQQYQAAAYQRARWFLTVWDLIALRMCGRPVSSTLAYFQPFPAEEIAAAGLPADLFPPLVEGGQPVAGLRPAAARETGLPVGLPVVGGTHDGIAAFIGAGLVRPGRAADVDGTSGGVALCWDRPIERPGIFAASWIHDGEYIVGGAMAALGKCLDWVRQVVGPGLSFEELIAQAVQAPPGAGGLIFLPYLAGERAPIWDPQARGVFFGLTLNHRPEHLVRAVLESVAFALRHVAGELIEGGARIDELRVCGGHAQSGEWNQIKADVTGFSVAVPRVREAALMGAAVLAGVGAGQFTDITSGANQMVRIDSVLEPDPERQQRYSQMFDIYKRLYPDLREAFQELSGLAAGEGS